MAIVLRFVDKNGLLKERFFGVVGVKDTTTLTLKKEISDVLTLYDLQIDDMRGQWYDRASNMRGAWNGLQALFLKECPYAYYVHCFAHQLQLALVAASKDVASPKRHSELQSTQVILFANKLATGELENGKGANQIKTLQRASATRWSSHFGSINSLIDLFGPSRVIIENLSKNGPTNSIGGDAKGVYLPMLSFELVFILHLLPEMMEITDILCQALQRKTQDIINAMNLVSSTNALLQNLRENGWHTFFQNVESFCKEHNIVVLDMSALLYDFQLMELNQRFSESTVELLILGTALDPKDAYKTIKVDDICDLVGKFYPKDFQDEMHALKSQLEHYKIDILYHPSFQNLFTISNLCKMLAKTRKRETYYLIDKLIGLILTLPVSTTTTERAFSAMRRVKTKLRNEMADEFLADCMILNIERELAEDIDIDSVVNEFDSFKDRRVHLQ
ncbi:uncharacterized protein LOC132301530 [Cornus florida]|uniref:uncharacterized protein LOC132301530 n=1 Tax=Cornus florida TaxID=4283 RepID=UPI00289E86F0|nr:uncharacterized protein LOC132301530 [Cornus florida]